MKLCFSSKNIYTIITLSQIFYIDFFHSLLLKKMYILVFK